MRAGALACTAMCNVRRAAVAAAVLCTVERAAAISTYATVELRIELRAVERVRASTAVERAAAIATCAIAADTMRAAVRAAAVCPRTVGTTKC